MAEEPVQLVYASRLPPSGGAAREPGEYVLFGILGFAYGSVLALTGFLAAGIGRGTYTVIGFSSSPLGLLHSVPVALFGTPLLWTGIGILLGTAAGRSARVAFLAAMAVHYVALFPILGDASHFGDWSYVNRMRPAFTAGVIVYATGQAAIWLIFLVKVLTARRHRQR